MRFYSGFLTGSLVSTLALIGVFALTTIEYRSTLFPKSKVSLRRTVLS